MTIEQRGDLTMGSSLIPPSFSSFHCCNSPILSIQSLFLLWSLPDACLWEHACNSPAQMYPVFPHFPIKQHKISFFCQNFFNQNHKILILSVLINNIQMLNLRKILTEQTKISRKQDQSNNKTIKTFLQKCFFLKKTKPGCVCGKKWKSKTETPARVEKSGNSRKRNRPMSILLIGRRIC